MKAWLVYAAVSLAVVLTGGVVGMLVLDDAGARAVWFAAAVAWVLQAVAFAAMVAVRSKPQLFLLGWLVGLVLRFGAVGVIAFWLKRSPVYEPSAALVSLVAFVFVLLLMEPLFLRRGLQTR